MFLICFSYCCVPMHFLTDTIGYSDDTLTVEATIVTVNRLKSLRSFQNATFFPFSHHMVGVLICWLHRHSGVQGCAVSKTNNCYMDLSEKQGNPKWLILYHIISYSSCCFIFFSIEPAMLRHTGNHFILAGHMRCWKCWVSLSHWTDCNFSCLQKWCLIDIKHNYLEIFRV